MQCIASVELFEQCPFRLGTARFFISPTHAFSDILVIWTAADMLWLLCFSDRVDMGSQHYDLGDCMGVYLVYHS